MVKSKIFLIVIFFILTSAFISLFSEENSSENTVKVGINNFLSKKQKQLIYFLIKDGLTSWSSNSKTKNSIFDDLDVIKVSTDKLFKDYNENEIKADNIYRNKKIVLSGVISSINRGIGEQYFVDFVSPKSFSSISAFFDDEYKEKLSKLKRHKNFSVFCIGDGMSIGSPILRRCKPINDWIEEEAINILDNYYIKLKHLVNIKDIGENLFLTFMFIIKIKTDEEIEKEINFIAKSNNIKDSKKQENIASFIDERIMLEEIRKSLEKENTIQYFESLDILQKIELIKQKREEILLNTQALQKN